MISLLKSVSISYQSWIPQGIQISNKILLKEKYNYYFANVITDASV